MATLRVILEQATREHWALGHFNASTLEQMRVICQVAKEVRCPAFIGTSEGERKHLGLPEAVALRDGLRRDFGIPVFLNADHSKSVESARAALETGYDSVHVDLSAEPFEANVLGTAEIEKLAHARDSELSVEGELGYLRGESQIQHVKIPVEAGDYTKPEEAADFVDNTGVDRLAIAVGNIHGISEGEPALDIERIKRIRQLVPHRCALVLHAGSGIPDDQIRAAIEAGIANIHINTDIRVAFTRGLREAIAAHPEETTPYKLYPEAEEAMAEVVREKLMLFGAVGRI